MRSDSLSTVQRVEEEYQALQKVLQTTEADLTEAKENMRKSEVDRAAERERNKQDELEAFSSMNDGVAKLEEEMKEVRRNLEDSAAEKAKAEEEARMKGEELIEAQKEQKRLKDACESMVEETLSCLRNTTKLEEERNLLKQALEDVRDDTGAMGTGKECHEKEQERGSLQCMVETHEESIRVMQQTIEGQQEKLKTSEAALTAARVEFAQSKSLLDATIVEKSRALDEVRSELDVEESQL